MYERGWRQSFAWAGFPGADKEFEYAMQYLQPQYGQGIVDLSCGSGLFTRRFVKSGQFSFVLALDFSENMLLQTRSYLQEDPQIDADSIALIRADVCRLPFKTGSVSAIHAGTPPGTPTLSPATPHLVKRQCMQRETQKEERCDKREVMAVP